MTGALSVQLTSELGFDPSGLGLVVALYFGVSALFSLPVGMLVERTGARHDGGRARGEVPGGRGRRLGAHQRSPPRLQLGRLRIVLAQDGQLVAGLQQLALGVEHEVDGLHGDTGDLCDVRHRRAGVATGHEQLVRGPDDAQPRLLRTLPARR